MALDDSGRTVSVDKDGLLVAPAPNFDRGRWPSWESTYGVSEDGALESLAYSPVRLDPAFGSIQGGNRALNGTPITEVSYKKHIDTDDPPQGKNFKGVDLFGIAKSQTGSVLVKLGAGKTPVTLTLTFKGTGRATFEDGSTTITLSPEPKEQVVKVKGVTASEKADDITLSAGAREGTTVGVRKFSVVGVTISLNMSYVSNNDPNWKVFKAATGQTEVPVKLGPLTVPLLFPNAGCSEGVEFTGTVTPSDYKGKLTFRRELLSKATYDWPADDPPSEDAPAIRETVRDDTSLDEYLTRNVTLGTIYHLDGPGPRFQGVGAAQSYRANFRQYVELGEWTRNDPKHPAEQVSSDFFWFARESCHSWNGNTYEFYDSYQADNIAGGAAGPTRSNGVNCTSTSLVNLSGSCN